MSGANRAIRFCREVSCQWTSWGWYPASASVPNIIHLHRREILLRVLVKCSGITRVGDTRGGNWGCHPSIFFSWKTWRPFFCSSPSLSLSLFMAFTRVSHLQGGVSPFLPVRPRCFSTIPCKFAHKFFSFGCHPPGGCHPGQSPHPSSDATGEMYTNR